MPLEPQWKGLIKVIIITIILGIIIYAIQWALISIDILTVLWVGWLNIITVLVFLILIYKWAKKYNYI